MARPRKDAPPAPPTQSVHLRLPLAILATVGAVADKKKQSRNTVIVALITKALRRKEKVS